MHNDDWAASRSRRNLGLAGVSAMAIMLATPAYAQSEDSSATPADEAVDSANPGEAIVVMKEFRAGYYPTHRHSGFADSPTTQPKGGGSGDPAFASHDHTLKNDYLTNTGPTSEYYYGLAVGDNVVLLRNQGGQSFLVLGRV